MHGLAVYVKEGLPLARDLSLGNSADSYLFFRFLFHLTYMRFSRSTHLLMFLSLETLTSIIRTGLPIPLELIDLVNAVIILNDLTQMVNFSIRIPDYAFHSPALLDLFLSSGASICSAMAFPPLGNPDHVVVSVCIDFPTNSQRHAPFHRIAYHYSRADWESLRHHLRDVPWEDIFKLDASAAASEFCEWVQAGIDVYIPHRKFQAGIEISFFLFDRSFLLLM